MPGPVMRAPHVRPLAALAFGLMLAACGGSTAPDSAAPPPAPPVQPPPSPEPDPYAAAGAEHERLRALEAGCCDLHEDAP